MESAWSNQSEYDNLGYSLKKIMTASSSVTLAVILSKSTPLTLP